MENKSDHTVEFCWHGKAIPEVEEQLTEELLELLESGLKNAESLMFHYAFLGGSDNPCIAIWGIEGDHRFHCEYRSKFDGIKMHVDDLPEGELKKHIKDRLDEL